MRSVALLFCCALIPDVGFAQATPREELVYTGTPSVQSAGEEGLLRATAVDSANAATYRLRIVRRGDRYFWASREDRELTKTAAGRYVIFSCPAGIIKLVNPLFDEARARLRASTPSEKYDYVEIMHTQLGVVIYWGRGQGVALPLS